MAAVAPITLVDGLAVSNTFTPIDVSEGGATYRKDDAALPIVGQLLITSKVSKPKGGLVRTQLLVDVPVMEILTGTTPAGYEPSQKVSYYERVKIEFISPVKGLESTRKNARVLASNLLLNSQIIDNVDKLRATF